MTIPNIATFDHCTYQNPIFYYQHFSIFPFILKLFLKWSSIRNLRQIGSPVSWSLIWWFTRWVFPKASYLATGTKRYQVKVVFPEEPPFLVRFLLKENIKHHLAGFFHHFHQTYAATISSEVFQTYLAVMLIHHKLPCQQKYLLKTRSRNMFQAIWAMCMFMITKHFRYLKWRVSSTIFLAIWGWVETLT